MDPIIESVLREFASGKHCSPGCRSVEQARRALKALRAQDPLAPFPWERA